MSNFFSRLSYSFGNEDWRSEKKALRIKSGDRVLCITASGDRPLNLLLDECTEIVSIDANPIQNFLLNLKCTAMQELDYNDYLEFLGAVPSHRRYNLFQHLLPYLDEQTKKYWIEKKRMIEKGILYQGLVEKQCKNILAPLIKLFCGKKVNQLFEFTDIDEQRKFVHQSWNKLYWKKAFDLAWNSVVSRLLFRFVVDDPGLHENLNGSVSIGSYFYKRMNDSLMENLARESLLLSLFLKGSVDRDAFPPYLTEEGFQIIRKRTHLINVKNIDIISYLESTPDNTFDCFSLSDVASYLNQKNFMKMMLEVQRVAKPDARYSIRQFLSDHKLSDEMQNALNRDYALEKSLEMEDRCFVYRFMAGSIKKV